MSAASIIYNWDSSTQILAEMTPQSRGDGFSEASMKIDFYGTAAQFDAAYPEGGKCPFGAEMYYTGTLIEEQSDGWTKGTVFAMGFWKGPPAPIVSYQNDTREIDYPFKLDDTTTIYWDGGTPPGATPGTVRGKNPETGKFWRVKTLVSTGGATRSGVAIRDAGAPFLPSTTPPFSGAPTNRLQPPPANLPDPVYTIPSGWVLTTFTDDPRPYGSKVFTRYVETWRWFDQKSYG